MDCKTVTLIHLKLAANKKKAKNNTKKVVLQTQCSSVNGVLISMARILNIDCAMIQHR